MAEQDSTSVARALPTGATLGNAAAGVVACALGANGHAALGALMVLTAVLMDSMDGAMARTFGVASDFGAELDSLADVISFGVAPALIVGCLLPEGARALGWAMATFYALCAVWRLARFNVAQARAAGEHRSFAGLPSPGAGAAAVSAVLLTTRLSSSASAVEAVLLPSVLLLLGALMVSHLPYRHLGGAISRLSPLAAAAAAALLIGAAVLWEYEHVFAAVMWAYVASGPVEALRERVRALRHA